jgi:hypothetical protein
MRISFIWYQDDIPSMKFEKFDEVLKDARKLTSLDIFDRNLNFRHFIKYLINRL